MNNISVLASLSARFFFNAQLMAY